jgi:hypothetical protein
MGALMRYGRLAGLAAAGGFLGVALLASPAVAATGSVSVAPKVVPADGTVTISGFVNPVDCPSSDGVTLTSIVALFPRAGFGPTVPRQPSGAFSTTYIVPSTTPPGTYTIGMRCGGGNVGVETTLRVTAQVSQLPARAPQAGLGGFSTSDRDLAAGWAVAGAVALVISGLLGLTLWRRRYSA